MNLMSETHHSCEKREHAFMVLRKYTIISPITRMIRSMLDSFPVFGLLLEVDTIFILLE